MSWGVPTEGRSIHRRKRATWREKQVRILKEEEQAMILTNRSMQREGQSGQASLCGEGEKSENRRKGSVEWHSLTPEYRGRDKPGHQMVLLHTTRRGHHIWGACMGTMGRG